MTGRHKLVQPRTRIRIEVATNDDRDLRTLGVDGWWALWFRVIRIVVSAGRDRRRRTRRQFGEAISSLLDFINEQGGLYKLHVGKRWIPMDMSVADDETGAGVDIFK
jgi:hypothetical protein